MNIAVTIRRDDLPALRPLLEEVRSVVSQEHFRLLEAPHDLDYAYQFPVVTVGEGSNRIRHFGMEAIELLHNISRSRT